MASLKELKQLRRKTDYNKNTVDKIFFTTLGALLFFKTANFFIMRTFFGKTMALVNEARNEIKPMYNTIKSEIRGEKIRKSIKKALRINYIPLIPQNS